LWIYFDSSALVKRYSAESGTELVNILFRQHPTSQMTCASICVLEIVSVLVRKHNDGRMSSELFAQALLNLENEIIAGDSFPFVPIDDQLLFAALDLITRHHINSSDAIILRSCLNVHQVLAGRGDQLILWSSDKRLLRAAKNEGVAVFDPEVETEKSLTDILG